ncbi:hypothetical protein [Herpetosiphon llansteffanensis]|uniref:hypothetical protein n=1 Tax=Herpetosiphon llansteffanensis TaxID=2094568 RepID=UPI000F51A903|nr:hypothetical protein [Herpetosiphon llansteffanensis]
MQQRITGTLADEIGERPATSTAEARAAAVIAAQMRQVGLEVGVQTFSAAAAPSAGLGLLAGIGLVALGLGWWLPYPSIALIVLLLLLAVRELHGPPILASLLRQRPSQNVIGTRAATRTPRARIVLLCHLDSPRMLSPRRASWLRVWLLSIPLGFSLGLATLGIAIFLPAWHSVVFIPGLLLLACLLVVLRRESRAAWTVGAVDAAAVGTAIALAADWPQRDDVELWVVALGAGAAAGSGIQALLNSYPFPKDETWFINLPWLGRGNLTVVAGEGLWRERKPDQQLAKMFHELQSASAPLIRSAYRGERLDSARLLALGYHAISVVGLKSDGTAAGFRQPDDETRLLSVPQMELALRVLRRVLDRFARNQSNEPQLP